MNTVFRLLIAKSSFALLSEVHLIIIVALNCCTRKNTTFSGVLPFPCNPYYS